jgi:ornithine cyclodeaminase/alanine dehydrogenase-like protein (mu-crystallin family)
MYQLSPTASSPLDAPCVLAQGATGTLLLSRSDVERLLSPDECIAAVENAFRQHALGKTPAPGVLGRHAQDGSFHIKAALLTLDQPYFAAETNANFPHNGVRHGPPTIQGVVVLCEAVRGLPLAVMDSMAIGDLHHAVAAGVMSRAEVRAELGEIVAGRKPARTSDEEIIVFDSSGTALQALAAAAAVYRRAIERGKGGHFSFNA